MQKIFYADKNENYDPFCSKKIKKILKRIIKYHNLGQYPSENYNKLQISLSKKYNNLSTENILIRNGSDEIIYEIINTFIDGKSKILLQNPIYEFYYENLKTKTKKIDFIPMLDNLDIDFEKLKDLLKFNEYDFIFLCSPNNPTGVIVEDEVIEWILNSTDCYVVIDQVYHFYHKSYHELLKKHKKLMLINSFSKNFMLPGIRLGYLFSYKENIKLLQKNHPKTPINNLSLLIGIILVEHYYEFYKNECRRLFKESKSIINHLSKTCNMICTNSCTNFIIFKSSDNFDYQKYFLRDRIIIKKLIINHQNYYRISVIRKKFGKTIINEFQKLQLI